MRGLECNSSQHAEGVSLLNVLDRGSDFGIKKLDVVTDNEENCDIMMGSRSVFDSNDPHTSIAFVQAAKKYDICNCRKEPREMIGHINDLAKAAFKADSYDLDAILEQKSYLFWGLPFVGINQNSKKIINALGSWNVDRGKDIEYPESYYIDVRNYGEKADALEGLLDSLDPKSIIIILPVEGLDPLKGGVQILQEQEEGLTELQETEGQECLLAVQVIQDQGEDKLLDRSDVLLRCLRGEGKRIEWRRRRRSLSHFLMETTPISSSISATTMADGISPPAAEAPSKDYASWTWRQKLLDIIRSDPSRNIMPEHPDSAAFIRRNMQVGIWSPSPFFSFFLVLPQLDRWIWFAKLSFMPTMAFLFGIMENVYGRFIRTVSPKLLPALEKDSVKKFYQVCHGWSSAMGLREFLYPDILASMTSYNALRCAKVALEGADPLCGRRADPNGRHRYGYAPLHVAAETFSVDMIKLLFQHGASANLRTGGERVIDGLLPLHVAVENTSMHKFLEDHWDDGDPVDNLIFLLSLPEMVSSLLLSTICRIPSPDYAQLLPVTPLNATLLTVLFYCLLCPYMHKKIVQAAILLLAAQKQLRDPLDNNTLNGFDIVKSHIGEDLDTIHREVLVMVKEGKNSKALKKLKEKEDELLTARVLVGTVHKDGEAVLIAHEAPLNGFDIIKGCIDEAINALHRESLAMIKEGENGKVLKKLKYKKDVLLTAHALVPHEEIIEQISSIMNRNGIVCYGKSIDTRNLECYHYHGGVPLPSDKSGSQRVVDAPLYNMAYNWYPVQKRMLIASCKQILRKQPKGLALKDVRNMFFPYWKSVLSRPILVKIIPTCQPSKKDLKSAETSRKGTKGTPIKSLRNLDLLGLPKVGSNFECRRTFCAVAWMSQKMLTRT
ncbi:hypothetical protein PR202_ga08653 [Eleusine coracana subsp. coracana]|uniref:Uncharacterized protein n=1 Tax=Eleusine coracana subsp. coracana TaxID=191504 RepID=A0AAV5C1Y8_ELECO|nr:hypothetical protein PR202_ga08653 [Eleusine coracana subsp. coracana]